MASEMEYKAMILPKSYRFLVSPLNFACNLKKSVLIMLKSGKLWGLVGKGFKAFILCYEVLMSLVWTTRVVCPFRLVIASTFVKVVGEVWLLPLTLTAVY